MRNRTAGLLFMLGVFFIAGCATVHQPPGLDSSKLEAYRVSDDRFATSDTLGTYVQFDLDMDQAINSIRHTCYELDIPLYAPLKSSDQQEAWISSGPFVAKCELDCACSGNMKKGPAANLASGSLSIRLYEHDLTGGIEVKVSSQFYRIESMDGEVSATINEYFDSTGRIERAILDALSRIERQPK
jgi:hypothetical protein